jgi:DNA-binding NtrC family response regulator
VLRIGARAPRRIDVRFIAATNRDLEAEAARGTFRQDLFFRLEGITLTIPPLRERVDEIPELARTFLAAACASMDRPRVPALSAAALAALQRWTWPGNVRELRNVMDRAAVLSADGRIEPHHFPPRIRDAGTMAAPPRISTAPAEPPVQAGSTADAQRERIIAALEACAGNQTQAAAKHRGAGPAAAAEEGVALRARRAPARSV